MKIQELEDEVVGIVRDASEGYDFKWGHVQRVQEAFRQYLAASVSPSTDYESPAQTIQHLSCATRDMMSAASSYKESWGYVREAEQSANECLGVAQALARKVAALLGSLK